MCFSVNVNLVKEELEDRYGVMFPDKYRYDPSYYYHAYGLPEIAAICSGKPDVFSFLKWGLIPSTVKTPEDADKIRYKTFNARSESIDTKPSFSSSFRTKRCLIPVRGFFEWQHVGKIKIPWYIYKSDNDLFTLAGLYSEWKPVNSDDVISTFSVITTEANEMMAEIHNSKKRMPAILKMSEEKSWIDISLKPADVINMLKPCPEGFLKAHTVGPIVNDRYSDRNTPEVIREYKWDSKNKLF